MQEKGVNFKIDSGLYTEVKIKIAKLDISLKDYITELIKKDIENGKEGNRNER